MYARISIIGTDILCECDDERQNAAVRIPLTDKALTTLTAWAQRYQRAALSDDLSPLTELGATMLGCLNESRWISNWMKGMGDRVLESRLPIPRALSSMRPGRFWPAGVTFSRRTRHRFQRFPEHRQGANAKPAQPTYRDLAMLSMAASPEGEQEINFEAEEAATLDATERLPLQAVAEESGCPDLLKDRLAQDGLFEAAHLCHGGIPENGELDGTRPTPVATGPCRNIGCARTQGSRSFSTGPTVACLWRRLKSSSAGADKASR